MIDGITIKTEIGDFPAWRVSLDIPFSQKTDTLSGEILTKKRAGKIITRYEATWETFNLVVKEVAYRDPPKTLFYLTLRGSLHKNQYRGKNYLPFTWKQLHYQVSHLCSKLFINAALAQISTLEVGINLVTPFEVSPFLRKNIISYKNYSFSDYNKDRDGFCLGKHCDKPAQYEIKIYDKGLQNNLPYPLMRFEKRFTKMQALNKLGIQYLSDLQQKPKIEGLLKILLVAWRNVLIYDVDPNIVDIWQCGQDVKYWQDLKDKKGYPTYYRALVKFKEFVDQNGRGWHELVSDLIQKDWQALFLNEADLGTVNDSPESPERDEFTLYPSGKFIPLRFCHSCGHIISNEKNDSN